MRSRGWPRVPLVWRIGRNRGSDRGALDDARPRPRRVNWPLARFSTTTYYRHAHCGLGPSVDASTPTTACAMPGRLQPRRSTKAGICAVAQPSDKSSPQCYPRPFSHCRLAACQFPTKGSQRRMLNLFLRFDIRRGDGPRDVRSCISTSLARPAHVIKQCRDGHWHWPQDEGTKCSRASLNISGAWRGGQSSHFFFGIRGTPYVQPSPPLFRLHLFSGFRMGLAPIRARGLNTDTTAMKAVVSGNVNKRTLRLIESPCILSNPAGEAVGCVVSCRPRHPFGQIPEGKIFAEQRTSIEPPLGTAKT